MTLRLSLIAAISFARLSAESMIEGPKLGFLYDQRAAAVRPIFGIPGAAFFGAPVTPELQQAVVSPSQDFALSVSAGDSSVAIVNFATRETRPLSGAKPAPTRIVFSSSGTSAAIANGLFVQVFSGLPAKPTEATTFQLVSEPSALAISDDGAVLLAAGAEAEATALYSYQSDGSAHRILTAGRIASLEFLNHSHDAVLADSTENKIILLRDGADPKLVANVDRPGAVTSSIDNRRIIVASAATRSLTTISLDDGTSSTIACECEPTALARLQGGAVFRITDLDKGPIWIFDTSRPESKAFFIPRAGGGSE